MIKKHYFGIKGKSFVKTYSDQEGYGVMRDGVIYQEAIDPTELNREYEEVQMEPLKEQEEN